MKNDHTFIVPNYNNAGNLAKCISQMLSVGDSKIIIYDDASTDNSTTVISCFKRNNKNRIRTVFAKSNKGYGHAVNKMIKLVKTEWFSIVEPDDEIVPDAYSIALQGLDSDYDMVKCRYFDRFDVFDRYILAPTFNDMPAYEVDYDINSIPEKLWHSHPSIWSGIYRTDLALLFAPPLVEAKGGGWVDGAFTFNMLFFSEKIKWMPVPIYKYTARNGGNSSWSYDPSIIFDRTEDMIEATRSNISIAKDTNCFLSPDTVQNIEQISIIQFLTWLRQTYYAYGMTLTIHDLHRIDMIMSKFDPHYVDELNDDLNKAVALYYTWANGDFVDWYYSIEKPAVLKYFERAGSNADSKQVKSMIDSVNAQFEKTMESR